MRVLAKPIDYVILLLVSVLNELVPRSTLQSPPSRVMVRWFSYYYDLQEFMHSPVRYPTTP